MDNEIRIDLFDIFRMGVDYGQLLMEQEREGEGVFDAFMGKVFDDKFAMPMAQTQTRQVHSKEWFAAKTKSMRRFQELYMKLKGDTEFLRKIKTP